MAEAHPAENGLPTDNTLPEQRIRIDVRSGGRGAVHVVEYRTDPAWAYPGYWTRRAASRAAFCGSLRALVLGVDAADWPTERVAPDLTNVTCKRCRARAERLFPACVTSPAVPQEETR